MGVLYVSIVGKHIDCSVNNISVTHLHKLRTVTDQGRSPGSRHAVFHFILLLIRLV